MFQIFDCPMTLISQSGIGTGTVRELFTRLNDLECLMLSDFIAETFIASNLCTNPDFLVAFVLLNAIGLGIGSCIADIGDWVSHIVIDT